mgnify:CR=1 FL=1
MTGLGILFIVLNTQQFLEARIETTIETSTAPLSVRYVLKVAWSQKVEGWFSNCQKCAENDPGIEKIKIPTFFAFTGLIYLQILQIGFRSIIN